MTPPIQTPLLLVSEVESTGVEKAETDEFDKLLGYILTATDFVEREFNRSFSERVDTRYYTARSQHNGGDVYGPELWLDDDLKSVITVKNGDSQFVPSDAYTLQPRSRDLNGVQAYRKIRLNPYGAYFWQATGTKDPVGAIEVTGVWGYGGQWVLTGCKVSGTMASSNLTASYTVTDSTVLEVGMTLKINDEYMYVDYISSKTEVTLARGRNGSSVALHVTDTDIYRWYPLELVRRLVLRLVAWQVEQRKAPLFGQMVVGDVTIPVNTDGVPKDIYVLGASLKRKQLPKAV